MSLEFHSPVETMTAHEFEHLTELAAEAWLKAVTRWEHSRKRKASFTDPASGEREAGEGDSMVNLAGARL
mgnify:CR=1 FL=1